MLPGISFIFIALILFLPLTAYATGDTCSTKYPVVLSHNWSGEYEMEQTNREAFTGDEFLCNNWSSNNKKCFEPGGIEQALKDEGAYLIIPNKVPYGSNEFRGKLLYEKCMENPLIRTEEDEFHMACGNSTMEPIDGIRKGLMEYCSVPENYGSLYANYTDCMERIKINIICHSQGCLDSRYLMASIMNKDSGKPMYDHVASWTSVAGINTGSILGDYGITFDNFFQLILNFFGFNDTIPSGFCDSLIALSNKHVTESIDYYYCDDNNLPHYNNNYSEESFNDLYPLPENKGIFYQTYYGYISRMHMYYLSMVPFRDLIFLYEGLNDGYTSIQSQKFLNYGKNSSSTRTPILEENVHHVNGEKSDTFWCNNFVPEHPGISHMGFTNEWVPGLSDNDECYNWSREQLYIDITQDLKNRGL